MVGRCLASATPRTSRLRYSQQSSYNEFGQLTISQKLKPNSMGQVRLSKGCSSSREEFVDDCDVVNQEGRPKCRLLAERYRYAMQESLKFWTRKIK